MRSLSFIPVFFFTVTACSQSLTPRDFGLVTPANVHCTSVKDQFMSSTCWSFASLSFLESEVIRRNGEALDLSEMFIARYSLLRKIHRHLKLKGQNYFTPGGQFHDVAWVIKNHGIVPESAYEGKPRGEMAHNHAELDTLLNHYVTELVFQGVTELTHSQQQFIDSVLDHYLGKVPDEFIYKGTVYNAFSFRERVLGLKMDDYVEISSYTHHPYYTPFVLEDKYNWTADSYYNVPAAEFSGILDHALKNGYTAGWDGDADDEYFYFNSAVAFLADTITDYARQRQYDFQSGVTTLNHLMHIVASQKDTLGRTWYYIKNSWGNYSNPLGGFLFMRDDYFRLRTVAIIVNKNAIPADIRARLLL